MDLRYCYEGNSQGFHVLPTFATTFMSVAAIFEGLDRCPGELGPPLALVSCLYTSIWRRLRAGQMRAAEALAAAKGASWLVQVLRGGQRLLLYQLLLMQQLPLWRLPLLQHLLLLLVFSWSSRADFPSVRRPFRFIRCAAAAAAAGGEAWLDAYGSEGFSLPGGDGLCDSQEIEFLSNASWILRV